MIRVQHYDGASALRRTPMLEAHGDGFVLIDDAGGRERYRWAELVAIDQPGDPAFGLAGRPGWRIRFHEGVPDAIAPLLPRPQRYGRLIDRFGLLSATIALLLISGIVVLITVRAPEWIAPRVPFAWEQRIGNAMIGDIDRRFCRDPAGLAALSALASRLDRGGPAVTIHVTDEVPIANAVALPGGHILIFRQLLAEAESPDEIAGVLAHEIGHVRNRDVMRSLLRQAGLGIVLGSTSGNLAGTANGLIDASYTRDAEDAADRDAIISLRAAHVSPAATARFFDRLARREGRLPGSLRYLSTHPQSAERARLFRAVPADPAAVPALTPDQWDALVDICFNDPTRRAERAARR